MNDKDWEIKVILQKDNSFIEHVLNSKNDVDEEDKMIRMIDNNPISIEEDERKGLLLEKANKIMSSLSVESQKVLNTYANCKGFQHMADTLGCSVSTAWKKYQKVLKEIEEIKNVRTK